MFEILHLNLFVSAGAAVELSRLIGLTCFTSASVVAVFQMHKNSTLELFHCCGLLKTSEPCGPSWWH